MDGPTGIRMDGGMDGHTCSVKINHIMYHQLYNVDDSYPTLFDLQLSIYSLVNNFNMDCVAYLLLLVCSSIQSLSSHIIDFPYVLCCLFYYIVFHEYFESFMFIAVCELWKDLYDAMKENSSQFPIEIYKKT